MKEIIKGQKVSLSKDLSVNNFIIGFNYDNPLNYDVDLSVMILSERGKIEEESDFLFYNNPNSLCNSVKIINEKNNFQKSVAVNTAQIPANIFRIMFVMTIDNGDSLNHRFENINNIDINIMSGNESVLNYKSVGLTKETAVILVEIYKHNNEWKFQATGNGFNSGLDTIIKNYGSEKIQLQEESEPSPSETKTLAVPVLEIKPEIKLEKIPAGSIDFVKKHKERIDLVKRHVSAMGLTSEKAEVKVVMDISASMDYLFKKGIVQDTFDRILPLAMQFDDDGVIDVWLFDDKCIHSNIPYTTENRENYVKRDILGRHQLGYGTNYAKPIVQISDEHNSSNKLPVYVLFFTDGNCADKKDTEKAMKNVSGKPIFWKFIGMGGNKPSEKKGMFGKTIKVNTGFEFLEKLDDLSGRVIDNADFVHIYDLNSISDDELYRSLLEEFPQWLADIRKMNILN